MSTDLSYDNYNTNLTQTAGSSFFSFSWRKVLIGLLALSLAYFCYKKFFGNKKLANEPEPENQEDDQEDLENPDEEDDEDEDDEN